MTQQQPSAYQRALQRAHVNGLAILGRGEWARGGLFFVVSSASGAAPHFVSVYPGRLSCDCPAGQHGKACSHRALVHEALQEERAAEPAIRDGFAAAERVARETASVPGATAVLASRASGKPFSIWK